jgi:hypothetical protein
MGSSFVLMGDSASWNGAFAVSSPVRTALNAYVLDLWCSARHAKLPAWTSTGACDAAADNPPGARRVHDLTSYLETVEPNVLTARRATRVALVSPSTETRGDFRSDPR